MRLELPNTFEGTVEIKIGDRVMQLLVSAEEAVDPNAPDPTAPPQTRGAEMLMRGPKMICQPVCVRKDSQGRCIKFKTVCSSFTFQGNG